FLSALEFHLGSPIELALVWPADTAPGDRQALLAPLLDEVFGRYIPNRVLTGGPEGTGEDLPLLAAKRARGRPTASVCEGYTCQAPTTEAAELGAQLDRRGGQRAPASPR